MRLCFRAFDAMKLMTSVASPIDQMSGAVFSATPPRGTHSRQKSLNRFGAGAAFYVFLLSLRSVKTNGSLNLAQRSLFRLMKLKCGDELL
jgi:hypothetical protein